MNIVEQKILLELKKESFENQRDIAKKINYSLGAVNNAINKMNKEKLIDKDKRLTSKSNNVI